MDCSAPLRAAPSRQAPRQPPYLLTSIHPYPYLNLCDVCTKHVLAHRSISISYIYTDMYTHIHIHTHTHIYVFLSNSRRRPTSPAGRSFSGEPIPRPRATPPACARTIARTSTRSRSFCLPWKRERRAYRHEFLKVQINAWMTREHPLTRCIVHALDRQAGLARTRGRWLMPAHCEACRAPPNWRNTAACSQVAGFALGLLCFASLALGLLCSRPRPAERGR